MKDQWDLKFFNFLFGISTRHLKQFCEDVGPCSPEQYFQLSSANNAQIIQELFAQ